MLNKKDECIVGKVSFLRVKVEKFSHWAYHINHELFNQIVL